MKNPFRKIQCIADWLDDRRATTESRKLRERYTPLIAEAEKKKDWAERDRLLSEWGFESDLLLHPVYGRKAAKLAARARKYGITVPPKPTNYEEALDENEDWDLSRVTGDWMLTRKAEQQLRREIKVESRASYDEFRKWATLFFAVVGSALAFLSVLSKQKQPDPCPRNYYRTDSGGCAFALQKDSAGQPNSAPVQAVPSATGNPPTKERNPGAPSLAQEEVHSARLGDVRVTVTQVRNATEQEIKQYRLRPRDGYHALLVFVTFKNEGQYPSCTSLDEWLRVKQGYEYPRGYSWAGLKTPTAHGLPATEESSGPLGFEVKDGTQPAVLRLVRNTVGESLCAQLQHRTKAISGPETVTLSLQGIPSN